VASAGVSGDLDRRKIDKSKVLEAKLMVIEADVKRLMGERL
jgi:hypothetical protein